jgi:hypothetical protein
MAATSTLSVLARTRTPEAGVSTLSPWDIQTLSMLLDVRPSHKAHSRDELDIGSTVLPVLSRHDLAALDFGQSCMP